MVYAYYTHMFYVTLLANYFFRYKYLVLEKHLKILKANTLCVTCLFNGPWQILKFNGHATWCVTCLFGVSWHV